MSKKKQDDLPKCLACRGRGTYTVKIEDIVFQQPCNGCQGTGIGKKEQE